MGRDYYDDVLDIAIKHAGSALLNEIAQQAPTISVEPKFSEGFEKRMSRLIAAEEKKRRGSKTLMLLARTAAVIAVVLIISSAVIFSSEALKERFMSMFAQHKEDSVDIEFNEILPEGVPRGMTVPGYIPEGYEMVKVEKKDLVYISEYRDTENNVILIRQFDEGSSLIIDSEDNAFETEIKGVKTLVSETAEGNYIVFNYNAYDYWIFGNTDVPELLKMAESIIK